MRQHVWHSLQNRPRMFCRGHSTTSATENQQGLLRSLPHPLQGALSWMHSAHTSTMSPITPLSASERSSPCNPTDESSLLSFAGLAPRYEPLPYWPSCRVGCRRQARTVLPCLAGAPRQSTRHHSKILIDQVRRASPSLLPRVAAGLPGRLRNEGCRTIRQGAGVPRLAGLCPSVSLVYR